MAQTCPFVSKITLNSTNAETGKWEKKNRQRDAAYKRLNLASRTPIN